MKVSGVYRILTKFAGLARCRVGPAAAGGGSPWRRLQPVVEAALRLAGEPPPGRVQRGRRGADDDRQEVLAEAVELHRADAGDAAELVQRRRAARRHLDQRAVGEDD